MLVIARHVGEHVDAHDPVNDDAAIADRVDQLAREQAGQRGFDVDPRGERADRGRRDRRTQDRERLDRRTRGRIERRQIPRCATEPRALPRRSASGTRGPRQRGVEPLGPP
jgi:hypothetical protein